MLPNEVWAVSIVSNFEKKIVLRASILHFHCLKFSFQSSPHVTSHLTEFYSNLTIYLPTEPRGQQQTGHQHIILAR